MRVVLEVVVDTEDLNRIQNLVAVQRTVEVQVPSSLPHVKWRVWGRLVGAKEFH